MAVQLWGIMMVLIIFTVIFMWGFQICFMEQNYISSSITEVQNRLSSVLQELAMTDLAENETMVSYLTSTAGGKTMIVSSEGQLIRLYSYGYPVNLEETGRISLSGNGSQRAKSIYPSCPANPMSKPTERESASSPMRPVFL